jgi:hypothetical protein
MLPTTRSVLLQGSDLHGLAGYRGTGMQVWIGPTLEAPFRGSNDNRCLLDGATLGQGMGPVGLEPTTSQVSRRSDP